LQKQPHCAIVSLVIANRKGGCRGGLNVASAVPVNDDRRAVKPGGLADELQRT
jgi:hypothetical protein